MSTGSKKIKFGAIILFGMNCLLGAGIFLTPGKAYAQAGMNVFWMLAICAVLAILLALVFAEMAGMFTRTGGVYVYVYEAYGPFLGFNIGFMRFLAACVALAVQMTALPSILQTMLGVSLNPWLAGSISLIFLVLLCSINMISVKVASIFTSFTSWLVLGTLTICILSTIFFVDFSNFSVPAGLTANVNGVEHAVPDSFGSLGMAAFSSGFLLLFYAFVGFENIGVAAQDMENPTRDVPRAIVIVLCVVTTIYFLLFFGIIGVMGGEKLVVSENSVADGVAQVLGEPGRWLISIGSILALTGIGLSMSFAGPRNLVPLAVDKFLPESAGANNSRGVPAQSIFIMMVITAFFIILGRVLSSEAFALLVQVATVARLIQYLAVSIGIFRIRKKGLPGTYKLPFAGMFVCIAVLVCLFLFSRTQVSVLISTLALIIISMIVYYAYAYPRYKRNR